MKKTKIKAILVDDEKEANAYLSNLLLCYEYIEIIGSFTQPLLAVEDILLQKPDLLFLDVQMPEMSGFQLLQSVVSDEYTPIVVFITGYEKYALEAIKNAAFAYLLKPISEEELELTLEKIAKQKLRNDYSRQLNELGSKLNGAQKLKFNTSTGFVIIDEKEIIYCEANRNYCEILITNDRREIVTCNMNQVHRKLTDKNFFRISRSNIINLDYLIKVERKNHICFLKKNGESIQLKISSQNLKILEKMLSES